MYFFFISACVNIYLSHRLLSDGRLNIFIIFDRSINNHIFGTFNLNILFNYVVCKCNIHVCTLYNLFALSLSSQSLPICKRSCSFSSLSLSLFYMKLQFPSFFSLSPFTCCVRLHSFSHSVSYFVRRSIFRLSAFSPRSPFI